MHKAALTAVWLCALAGSPAGANDSSAELATGGLVIEKSADIEMRAEDLYVSAKEIRVKAHFYNASAKDVQTVVAFPMPDFTIEHPGEVISVPRKVSTGANALRSAMRRSVACEKPQARAWRMKSLPMISMAIARVCLMIGAMAATMKHRTGSTSCAAAERSAAHSPERMPAMKLSIRRLPVMTAGAVTSSPIRPIGAGAHRSR